MGRQERRFAWWLFAAISLGALAAIAVGGSRREAPQPSDAANAANTQAAAEAEPFTIAATGGLIVQQAVAEAARTPGGWDFTAMFANVADALRGADLAVCHLETPLSPDNSTLSYSPPFLVPNQFADAIAAAGYDTCSLASDHAAGAGLDGATGTIDALDRVKVAHAGMGRSPDDRGALNLVEVKGVVVAHLSHTFSPSADEDGDEGEGGSEAGRLVNVIDEEAILSQARRARDAGAVFVILSLHWGTEFQTAPDAFQSDLGPRLLAAEEIDLILGHHAHVVQPLAELEGEYLAYGLGNFLSRQSPATCAECPPGAADGVILHLRVAPGDDDRWQVSDAAYTPTWFDGEAFEVVDVLRDRIRDPAVLVASAARTAGALTSLGVAVTPSEP